MNKVTKRIGGIVFSAAMALSLVVVAAPETAQASTTCTVYFDNSDGWSTVNAYFADADWVAIEGYESYDEWPGVEISDSDGDGWYEVTFALPDNGAYIIFNDGSSQTTDIAIASGTAEAWVAYASYGQDVEKGTAASTTAPDGWSSSDANAASEEDTTSETTSESTSTEKTTQAGDATPIVAVLVALMGCAVIVVASKKKAA